jgi:hypothetical protein
MRSAVLPCWRKLSAGGKRRSCERLSQAALQDVRAVQRCGLGIFSETCGECRVVCRVAEGLRQLNAVTDACQSESRPRAWCRTAGIKCLSGTTAAAAHSAFRRWPASEIRTLTAARVRERAYRVVPGERGRRPWRIKHRTRRFNSVCAGGAHAADNGHPEG